MILGIFCAGGFGRETMALARYINSIYRYWENIIFVDDVVEADSVMGAEVWRSERAFAAKGNIQLVVATGEPRNRKMLYDKIVEAGVEVTKLIAPGATIIGQTYIPNGCIIGACFISDGCTIGINSVVNDGAMLGHDSKIGDHCVVGTRAFLSGNTRLGNGVYVGVGALIKEENRMDDWSVASIGSVVYRPVKEGQIVLGNPAKVIGENEEHTVFHR